MNNPRATILCLNLGIFLSSTILTIVTATTFTKLQNLDLNNVTVDELKHYEKVLAENLQKVRGALQDNTKNGETTKGEPEEMLAMNEGSGEDGSSETEMVTEQLIPTQEAKSAGTTTMAPTKEPVKSDPTNSTYSVPPPQPALDEKKPQKSHHPRTPISATIPNRNSSFFMDRIGSLRKSPKDPNDRIVVVASGVRTVAAKASAEEATFKYEGGQFDPRINHTAEECRQLSQAELVQELKQKGTYNPDLMAWDVMGVIRFLDRTITDQYEWKNRSSAKEVVERNVEALARIVHELNATCDLRVPHVRDKIANLTLVEPRRTILSPALRMTPKRRKREIELQRLVSTLLFEEQKDEQPSTSFKEEEAKTTRHQKLVGESHIIPFGCDKRGTEEAGYLRLCGACQAIRRLPEDFFPPFINEVTCDVDKACLYFYDYPHGKCRQKHMNFVVLRNVGSAKCQIWKKFNLNVRVSCECFVDEMSFFAKYV